MEILISHFRNRKNYQIDLFFFFFFCSVSLNLFLISLLYRRCVNNIIIWCNLHIFLFFVYVFVVVVQQFFFAAIKTSFKKTFFFFLLFNNFIVHRLPVFKNKNCTGKCTVIVNYNFSIQFIHIHIFV